MGSTLETGVWGKAIPSATDSCPESFFYLFCVCLPLAVFWAYMGNILIAFGEDPLISSEAGKYARRMIPTRLVKQLLNPLLNFL